MILSAGIHGLPSDLLRECSGRLGYAALLWGSLWILAPLLNAIGVPVLPAGPDASAVWPWPGNAIAAAQVSVSVALFAYTRRTSCDSKRSLDLGLVYQVFLALGIAVADQWTPRTSGVSWIALLILLHPTIVPNTSRHTLFAGLASATMDPLGLALAAARGMPIPELPAIAATILPTYLAAGVAILPSRVVTALGRRLRRERELGGFVLGDLLGRGGMGEVYAAHHRLLRRPAAVKLIRPDAPAIRDRWSREMFVERFWREADAAASLSSPHAIALYDFGVTDNGTFYYVMELLRGLDFESLVTRFGPVSPGRVIYLLRQVCHALGEAHAIGLIHRDIKPSNLYACRVGLDSDFVKVIDFGLVKSLGPELSGDPVATAPNVVLGTPAFMAPEVALGTRTLDHRVDLYGLGCVASWLLTGRLVFEAETPMKMMIQHAEATPMPPSRRSELRIPPCLDDIVLACLAKVPADRPADAAQLADMLAACPVDDGWSPADANRWWDTHLPELGAPRARVPPGSREASPDTATRSRRPQRIPQAS